MNRRHIVRLCKKQGLHVQPATLKAIQASQAKGLLLEKNSNSNFEVEDDGEEAFQTVLRMLKQKLAIRSGITIVSPDLWEQTLEEYTAADANATNTNANASTRNDARALLKTAATTNSNATNKSSSNSVQVISAFDTPRLVYDTLLQQFHYEPCKPSLLGTAQDKLEMMTQRYAMIHQRVMRNELFKKGARSQKLTLTSIDRLLGTANRTASTTFVLLGLLRTNQNATDIKSSHPYCLEDVTGTVTLDLTQAVAADKTGAGFYTEQSMVLVQGHVGDDEMFVVHRMGFPPLETRTESEFVVPLLTRRDRGTLPPLEVYVFNNVHLDDPLVVSQLQGVLEDLESKAVQDTTTSTGTPFMLVFMGDFGSSPQVLDELTMLVESCPYLQEHAHFVIVPGPNDSVGLCLPQPPLHKPYTLGQTVQKLHMASNPCRIQYGASQIVLFRSQLTSLLAQQELFTLKGGSTSSTTGTGTTTTPLSVSEKVSKTILEQGHLIPCAANTTPVFWNMDHALRLYPLPAAVILGESDAFSHAIGDCHVVSPGNMVQGKFVKYTLVPQQPQHGQHGGGGDQDQDPVQFYPQEAHDWGDDSDADADSDDNADINKSINKKHKIGV
jgi:DNA polymerase epsilon subunit 2